jgi:hypothetical protein
MRFPFYSLVSSFQRRQQAVVKLLHLDTYPCETITISYKSEEGNDCRYEFKIPAPITVQITFSNGRHIRLNSDGKYETSTVDSHDKPPLPLWPGVDDALSRSAAGTIKSVHPASV